ncbi:MAG: IclR family transcriptional regulator [Paraburkholderia tropica]|uniref:IclR family transcriptional regulator n=1 Tax=Burkholderia gladioli TaxID=28095 RepID=UPI000F52F6E1|nr:IclR family transcriptional regulator [Burkholderia gladioli]MBU9192928.1 IclR family transcriptional regulator [Burkholderia gladioli]
MNTDGDDTGAGGVTAVRRAMKVLEAFGMDDVSLSLAELSRRTGYHRSTVLRLARTLAMDDYLVQKDDGSWRLGRASGWLGACYQATFNVHDIIEPVLRELSIKMGESATFYVREGEQRTCVVRVEGPRAVRHHVRMGGSLPLSAGGPGLVILAFNGERGEPFESIRRDGYRIALGERDAEVASVSAPVFGVNWKFLGALCVSGPISRLTSSVLREFVPAVIEAGKRLSYDIAGNGREVVPDVAQQAWHP